jgi:hypothetical protein
MKKAHNKKVKDVRIFHLTIKRCCDCPYGAFPICDLTNDEKYNSSKIHPDCPLPTEAQWASRTELT